MVSSRESETTTKKPWKDQLADLDKQFGWDTTDSSIWEDEADQDEGHLKSRPTTTTKTTTTLREVLFLGRDDDDDDDDDDECAIIDEDDEEYYSAVENTDDLDDLDDDGTRAHGNKSPRPEETFPDFELSPSVMDYVAHRFWPTFRYEDRCSCHEWLVDSRELRDQAEREYYARHGTRLQQDWCVLRESPQADVPGTEEVDRPVVTVTTPDGETLYPHDEREWP